MQLMFQPDTLCSYVALNVSCRSQLEVNYSKDYGSFSEV